ncbi:MAG: type II toxin-antitoxin system RelE/ParE family toxin [Alphaproteobacteria bacterium]
MIRGFKSRDTEAVFRRKTAQRIPTEIYRRAHRKLLALHAAIELSDLRIPPSNRLEVLKGTRSGQHSIRVNNQRRICFRWQNGDAYDVEIVDYH